MHKNNLLLIAGAFALIGACSKTDNGNIEVKKPVGIETQTDTLHPPQITTKTDTISTPVVGTKKDTIVIDKPVVGTKKTEVKVPTITKKP